MRIVLVLAVLVLSLIRSVAHADPATIDYVPGTGTIIRSGDGADELRLAFRFQIRLQGERLLGDAGDTGIQFFIPRSRLFLEGFVFTNVNYRLDLAVSDQGATVLKDMYIEPRVAGDVRFRAGQFKRPFNREDIDSDFATFFPEKAETDAWSGGTRDLGVMLHDGYEKSPPFEWAVGVFDGVSADKPTPTTTCSGATPPICMTGTPSNVPADWDPAIVVRAGFNLGGIKGYSEGDLEGGPPRLAVAASYWINLSNLGDVEFDGDNFRHAVELDATLKAYGLEVDVEGFAVRPPHADTQLATHEQVTYVLGGRYGFGGRFAIEPGAKTGEQIEARGVFAWFFHGHAWKWTTDAGVVQATDPSATTVQVRTQAQLVF